MLIAESLRTYILETFLFTDKESSLNNDDSLMAKGIIDSTGILEMVPENLDSINKIVAFVTQKTGSK
jgi:acyl carrier protein